MITPLYDRVVLKPEPPPEKVGGIYLPDSTNQESNVAEVMAVGPGKRTDTGKMLPCTVKVGDRVVFNNLIVQQAFIDGEDYLVTPEENIFGTL